MYVGESHRTLHDRSLEHHQKLVAQKNDSALYKHWQKAHGDQEEPPKFSHKVIRSFRTSTERQVFEAITINNIKCDQILDSKAEYIMP